MKTYIAATLVGLAALGFTGSQAQAQNDDVYAGVGCHAVEDTDNFFDRTTGIIGNSDAIAHEVFCPIIRNDLLGGLAQVRVVVADLHPGQNVNCTLAAHQPGGAVIAPAVVVSSAGATVPEELDFGPLAAAPNVYFTLRCSIPGLVAAGQSFIASYRVQQ